MATKEAVVKVLTMVWMKFPSRRPKDKKEYDLACEVWFAAFADIADKQLMDATARMVRETDECYPSSCPFAKILKMAQPAEGQDITHGDFLQLAFDSVSKFGYMREDDALAWVSSKSRLAGAALRRFGFMALCMSEDQETTRAQLRMIFEEEKRRSAQVGGIVDDASKLVASEPVSKQIEQLARPIGIAMKGG